MLEASESEIIATKYVTQEKEEQNSLQATETQGYDDEINDQNDTESCKDGLYHQSTFQFVESFGGEIIAQEHVEVLHSRVESIMYANLISYTSQHSAFFCWSNWWIAPCAGSFGCSRQPPTCSKDFRHLCWFI